MRRYLGLAIPLCLALLGGFTHPMVGKPAPPFTVSDVTNHEVKLADYAGKSHLVLVFYWAHS